ncbi:phosphotransferase family protein [Alkalicoccus luteus]|uniref:phosphotransferase family protein n=1 Tax=Alkalicoccus luteus TaxID=1237094 RepID=UPI00403369BF
MDLFAGKRVKQLKGFSQHPCYLAEDGTGRSVIKRFPLAEQAKRREQLRVMERLFMKGLPVQEVMCVQEEAPYLWVQLSWIEGEDLRSCKASKTEADMYRLGREAGALLRKLHDVKAPAEKIGWADRAWEKHLRYEAVCKEKKLTFSGIHEVSEWVKRHRHWMNRVPERLQHDDFHLGNLLVSGGRLTGVIDFDNMDWGDPYHDFVKTALFQLDDSRAFACGQIHGYFHDQVPSAFWERYSLYTAMVLFSSLAWGQMFAPKEEEMTRRRIDRALRDHHHFKQLKPAWYEEEDVWST